MLAFDRLLLQTSHTVICVFQPSWCIFSSREALCSLASIPAPCSADTHTVAVLNSGRCLGVVQLGLLLHVGLLLRALCLSIPWWIGISKTDAHVAIALNWDWDNCLAVCRIPCMFMLEPLPVPGTLPPAPGFAYPSCPNPCWSLLPISLGELLENNTYELLTQWRLRDFFISLVWSPTKETHCNPHVNF